MKVLITLIALTLSSSAMAHIYSFDHGSLTDQDRVDLISIIKSADHILEI